MRMRMWIGSAVAVACLAGGAAPAVATHNGEQPPAGCRYIRGTDTPEDHEDDVYVCRQDVWFHKASTRVGNLAGPGLDTVPSWNTTKPTGPFQEVGAIYAPVAAYDIFVAQDPHGRAIFTGTFTGTLDTLAIQAYLRAPVWENLGGNYLAVVYVEVDGEVIYDNFPSAAVSIPLKPAGNFRRIDAVVVNMYDYMKELGLDLSPTKEHTVEIGLVPWYFGDSHSVVFYDAAEVPSGLIFNLAPQNQGGFTKIDALPSEG